LILSAFLDAAGNTGTVLSQDRYAVADHMIHSKKLIMQSAMPNLQLHYTEWSASYTPSDPIHDSYHEAAYILNTVKRAAPYVNSMSYWTFTDIFEEAGPRATPFHGGFGLINYEDIKKPAFYAFKYLNELGHTELQSADSSAIICTDDKGNVQALVWNFTIDHPGDSVNNQVFYKRLLPSKALSPVEFKLHGLKPGKYNISIYKTGFHANDPYSAYFEMGSPSQLTRAQVKLLQEKSADLPIEQSTVTINTSGNFTKQLPIRQNDVILIKINRVN
jgi:xylan 1,4-beta-xylosidase